MKNISAGVFQVNNGETITIDVKKSAGSKSLFGVNYSVFGGGTPLKEGTPLKISMDKSKATGGSFVENAKSTSLTLLFNFTTDADSGYEWTVTGEAGGDTYNDSVMQAGKTPEAKFYTFHIV